ncbi:MAG TPA: hypothetical protein VIV11_38845 [Kofleriaceae bacterium]
MDGKVIDNVQATPPSPGAEEGDQAPEPALDGSRFHDQGRFRSSEVTRAFASATRAVSKAPQSEVSEPDEVTLEPSVAITDMQIVRGVD